MTLYAADDFFATLEEVIAHIEPCIYVVDGEQTEDGWSLTQCGAPSIDDEPPLCAEHLGLAA